MSHRGGRKPTAESSQPLWSLELRQDIDKARNSLQDLTGEVSELKSQLPHLSTDGAGAVQLQATKRGSKGGGRRQPDQSFSGLGEKPGTATTEATTTGPPGTAASAFGTGAVCDDEEWLVTGRAVAAAQRADAAADATRGAVAEVQRLKAEIERVLRALSVPFAGGSDGQGASGLEGQRDCDGMPGPAEGMYMSLGVVDVGLPDAVSEHAGVPYATSGEMLEAMSVRYDSEGLEQEIREAKEREQIVEERLAQLEEQLEGGSVLSESQVAEGFRAVVGDVRRCLKRCELLSQLPEIKLFIKRFRMSLAVNAILSEGWVGPGKAKAASPEVAPEPRPASTSRPRSGAESTRPERSLTKDEHSRSLPDFSHSKRTGKLASPAGTNRRTTKKPFRTVGDWVRPHTPMTVDPVWKGHPMLSPVTSGVDAESRPGTGMQLPQVKVR